MCDILYFDCLSGISGDMTVAALIDCGVDVEYLKQELNKLNLNQEYTIEVNKKDKQGIQGIDFNVIINHHHDEHSHDFEDEHHQHHHDHDHNDHHHHEHRNIFDIKKIIETSELNENVKNLSLNIFKHVGNAEAKVHGKTIEQVHFHEVGAIDSIIDIVAVSICIDYLKPKHIYSSPIHIGTGFVECQHGIIPVPAPATLEILKGIPVYQKGIQSELVTPTGAAIIKSLAEQFITIPDMKINQIGYGLGKKDLSIKNLLRIIKGKKKQTLLYK